MLDPDAHDGMRAEAWSSTDPDLGRFRLLTSGDVGSLADVQPFKVLSPPCLVTDATALSMSFNGALIAPSQSGSPALSIPSISRPSSWLPILPFGDVRSDTGLLVGEGHACDGFDLIVPILLAATHQTIDHHSTMSTSRMNRS